MKSNRAILAFFLIFLSLKLLNAGESSVDERLKQFLSRVERINSPEERESVIRDLKSLREQQAQKEVKFHADYLAAIAASQSKTSLEPGYDGQAEMIKKMNEIQENYPDFEKDIRYIILKIRTMNLATTQDYEKQKEFIKGTLLNIKSVNFTPRLRTDAQDL